MCHWALNLVLQAWAVSAIIRVVQGLATEMATWMNDTGFWTVSKLSGFTESETLRNWTVIVSVESATGLLLCLRASMEMPSA